MILQFVINLFLSGAGDVGVSGDVAIASSYCSYYYCYCAPRLLKVLLKGAMLLHLITVGRKLPYELKCSM
jgi:hypothetical protein